VSSIHQCLYSVLRGWPRLQIRSRSYCTIKSRDLRQWLITSFRGQSWAYPAKQKEAPVIAASVRHLDPRRSVDSLTETLGNETLFSFPNLLRSIDAIGRRGNATQSKTSFRCLRSGIAYEEMTRNFLESIRSSFSGNSIYLNKNTREPVQRLLKFLRQWRFLFC
jgi:hypothetical protein